MTSIPTAGADAAAASPAAGSAAASMADACPARRRREAWRRGRCRRRRRCGEGPGAVALSVEEEGFSSAAERALWAASWRRAADGVGSDRLRWSWRRRSLLRRSLWLRSLWAVYLVAAASSIRWGPSGGPPLLVRINISRAANPSDIWTAAMAAIMAQQIERISVACKGLGFISAGETSEMCAKQNQPSDEKGFHSMFKLKMTSGVS